MITFFLIKTIPSIFDGQCFIVRADEKLTALMELESAIRAAESKIEMRSVSRSRCRLHRKRESKGSMLTNLLFCELLVAHKNRLFVPGFEAPFSATSPEAFAPVP